MEKEARLEKIIEPGIYQIIFSEKDMRQKMSDGVSDKIFSLLNNPKSHLMSLNDLMKKIVISDEDRRRLSPGNIETFLLRHHGMVVNFRHKNYLLVGGDGVEGETVLESVLDSDLCGRLVTCSWVCLWRMLVSNKLRKPELNKSQFLKLQRILHSKKFEIIDLLDDDIIHDNSKECKNHLRNNRHESFSFRKHPTKYGYVHIGNYRWHRAGSMCFKFDGSYYVMGMDDGSYFCSQLPKGVKPKTVQEALDSLRPDNVPKGSLRQGEWFAVPVKKKDVPSKSCVSIVDDRIGLPAELNSNIHYFEFRGRNRIITQDNVRVWNNEIFVLGDGTKVLWHEEHPALVLPKGKWFKFVRNTAVRSVSVTGVD